MTVQRNVGLWRLMLVIGPALIAGQACAEESAHAPATATAEQNDEVLQLFQATYGADAGQARYDEWCATKDLPLDAYLKTDTDDHAGHATPGPTITPPPNAAASPSPAPAPAPAASTRPQYQLTDGDVLRIAVWQWPHLRDDEVVVRPDGKISFPLIGEIAAVGLTLDQLDERMTAAMQVYIKNPQVTLSMRRFGGRKIVVLGHVKSPGVYLLGAQGASGAYAALQHGTLLEALALAGGFASGAQRKRVIILRGGIEHPQILRVDVNRTLLGRDRTLASNIPVEADDIIYVAPTRLTKVVEDIDPLIKIINTAFQTYVGTTTLQQNRQSTQ